MKALSLHIFFIITYFLNIINIMNICIFTLKRFDKKTLIIFQVISAAFTIVLGTILHFTYQWSNENSIVGLFSAVNESTWEHLKLLFFPMLTTIIIGHFYLGENVYNFLCAKTIGIIISITSTIIVFYTYTGILGTNSAVLNILTFIISVMFGEYIAYRIMLSDFKCNKIIAFITIALLLFSFIIFKYYPPKIGLFKTPLTNKYEINKI